MASKNPFAGMIQVHFEYSSAAGTVAALSCYGVNGQAIAVGSNDQVVLTDIVVILGATGTRVDVFDDINANGTVDAGERIVGGVFPANGGVEERPQHGRWLKVGDVPSVLPGAAVQVDVVCLGFLGIRMGVGAANAVP